MALIFWRDTFGFRLRQKERSRLNSPVLGGITSISAYPSGVLRRGSFTRTILQKLTLTSMFSGEWMKTVFGLFRRICCLEMLFAWLKIRDATKWIIEPFRRL